MKTIVCFGDSNTHGYDNKTGGRHDEEHRWTCILQKLLGNEYAVKEEGLSGRETVFDDPLTEGLSGIRAITPVLMTHEPVDLLIIMLGTNDVKERFGATPTNIQKGMARLIKKAKHTEEAWRNGKVNILLVCPPPILDCYSERIFGRDMGRNCAEKSRELAPLYEETAKELGCAYLDAGAIEGVEMADYDGMHMGAESHKLFAEKLAEIIPDLV